MRNLQAWNIAVVGKIAWHVSHLKDSLWVRWVHGVYTKGGRWEIFNAPITTSWTLKKICCVKDLLLTWISKDKYSIKETYMAQVVPHLRIRWINVLWNRRSIPKTRFIYWMAAI